MKRTWVTMGWALAVALPGCGDSETAKGHASELPCDVAAILQEHCQSCHGEPLKAGAPMPLLERAHFTRAPLADEADSVGEAMLGRLRDEQSPMPPADRPRLTSEELEVLEAWVEAGLPKGKGQCETGDADGDVPAPLSGPPDDCEEFHDFLAHGEEGDSEPFDVSAATSGNLYECFNFKVPWGEEPLHGLYFEPLPDDERVLHHYILYGIDDGAGMEDGSIGCVNSASRFRMEGWAPGREPSSMPDGVGYQMPTGPDAFIQLEVHYNNTAGHDDARDKSGVRVCTTSKLREHTAASHWLGTENISVAPNAKATAQGVCRPEAEATILRLGPHMHIRGVHMKTLLTRADGTEEVLLDEPFSFEDQIQYDLDPPVVVGPGDKLTTTCSYEDTDGNGARFGPNTEDEMCYNFATAYPAGALVNTGGFSFGLNRCTSFLAE